ncbi:MAG: NAD(P)-dependent dehydrogenase (short-subunit alcohol dehydrogenase family) [Gammaproteobacteria bacterium]|jgi:NAD(P)-dependent dehydrogenase (short-subunit alcohol dehydrogenase family)
MSESALIVGVGDGLSASLARLFRSNDMRVMLAARRPDKLEALAEQTEAVVVACDASDPASVQKMFATADNEIGTPDIVVYNPSSSVRGPVSEIDAHGVRDALLVTCYGGFLVVQEASKRMLVRGTGSLLLTGASASVKGFANSSSFAMGKFGLRGLAQSSARELAPHGIHVAHFVLDGGIRSHGATSDGDTQFDPDAIAQSYLDIHRQHRSAWTWEVELRPWVEKF